MYIDHLLTSKKALMALALTLAASSAACSDDATSAPEDNLTPPADDEGTPPADDDGEGGDDAQGGSDGQGGDDGEGGAPPEATGSYLWSDAYGALNGNGLNQTHVGAMASDAAGNMIVVGTFRGVVSFGGANLVSSPDVSDMYVAKYDAAGDHVWSKSFSTHMTNQIVQPRGIATDASGAMVIVGRYTGLAGFGPSFGGGPLAHVDGDEMFAVELDAAGDHVWSAGYTGAGHQRANAVAIDGGKIAIVGEDDDAARVVMLDAYGSTTWDERYGGGSRATDVCFDASGNVVVVGEVDGSVDFGGGAIASNGFEDIFAASLASTGAHRWSAGYGDAARQEEPRVAADASGDLVIAASFDGSVDFGGGALDSEEAAFGHDIAVAKLDADGAHLWSAAYGDAGVQRVHDLAIDSYGRIVIAGGFSGSIDLGGGALVSDGQDDVLVAKLDADGSHLWSYDAGDAFDQEARALAIGADDDVVIAGKLLGEMDLAGNDPISNLGGGFAMFIAALSQ